MLDDFTPIIHELPGRTVKVWAVADVHIGAREADIDGFAAFLEKVQSDDDSYLVIVGDLLNNATRSSVSDVYQETMPPHAQVDKAVELLAPVADRILGCVGGNHERRSVKDVDLDPMYQVMCMLRKPELYRAHMAFMRVSLRNIGASTHDQYALMLVHGKTDNKKRWLAQSVEGVDAIISGYTHNGIVEKPARLVFTQKNKVQVRPLVSLTATSWLGYGGYAMSGLLLPKATGDPQCLVLEFAGTNNRRGSVRVSW